MPVKSSKHHPVRQDWKTAAGFLGSILALFALPFLLNGLFSITGLRWEQLFPWSQGKIAPLFTLPVQHWSKDIERWAAQYNLDPNLMATIMQIESCGHPTVVSSTGAQGLFQVMPFHFAPGEQWLDAETNAMRSANFIQACSRYANGDAGLILACYNGGPSVIKRSFHTWAAETQRYYLWAVGIYSDALNHRNQSQTLNNWLSAGGEMLCRRATRALGL